MIERLIPATEVAHGGANLVVKPALVAAATGVGFFVEIAANDGVRGAAMSFVGVCALVIYRLFRKFKKEPVAGRWDFLDRNVVELILAGLILPNAANALSNWASRLFNAIP